MRTDKDNLKTGGSFPSLTTTVLLRDWCSVSQELGRTHIHKCVWDQRKMMALALLTPPQSPLRTFPVICPVSADLCCQWRPKPPRHTLPGHSSPLSPVHPALALSLSEGHSQTSCPAPLPHFRRICVPHHLPTEVSQTTLLNNTYPSHFIALLSTSIKYLFLSLSMYFHVN
jgi:hypothetical protein